MTVSFTGVLPEGWEFKWQEADVNWNGIGAEHNLSEIITVANNTGARLTKKFLIKAVYIGTSGSISGTISYAGTNTGTIIIQVFENADFSGTPSYSTTIVNPGIYTLTGLVAGTYYCHAFMDINGNSEYNPATDPYGQYFNLINLAADQNIVGINIDLIDPPVPGGGGGGGGVIVGPLALVLSGLLSWLKKRKLFVKQV
jgi:hypothetical protein